MHSLFKSIFILLILFSVHSVESASHKTKLYMFNMKKNFKLIKKSVAKDNWDDALKYSERFVKFYEKSQKVTPGYISNDKKDDYHLLLKEGLTLAYDLKACIEEKNKECANQKMKDILNGMKIAHKKYKRSK